MDELRQDLRYAVRQLLRRPGFTAILVLTLALAVGANTAVFSVVHAVLIRPLPYPHQERLVMVWSQFPSMDLLEFPSSAPEYLEYRDQTRSFDHLAGFAPGARTLTGEQDPERVEGVVATSDLFAVLGVEALHGRTFAAEEDAPGAAGTVVVSERLWRRRWGADPGLVGRDILVDGEPRTVLGILPMSVRFPTAETDLWLPLGLDPADPGGRASHYLAVVGRLRPGVTPEGAAAELGTLMERWAAEASGQHTWAAERHPAVVRPLTEQLVGDVRQSLVVLFGAVVVVLLIACANVANLLLVRGEGRQREIAVRSALGARRGRVVRQLVTESLITALLGGVAGLALGWLGVGALRSLAPEGLPRVEEVAIHPPVLLFSLGVTLAAGLLFGLAPAFQVGRMDVHRALREEGRGSGGKGGFALRQILVVSETAMAVVLLVAAGLLIQSFFRLRAVDPGFRPESVLTLQVSLSPTTYPDAGDVTAFYRDLIPRLGSVPGVTAAAAVRTAPLGGSLPPNDIEIEGNAMPRGPDDPPANADVQMVAGDFFEAMGIPLRDGRVFDSRDGEDAPLAAVINETLARRFWPDRSPLGQRIRQRGDGREDAEIVGVVGDIRQEGLDVEPRAMLYFTHAQSPRTWFPVRAMTLVLRSAVPPLSLTAAVRREIQARDPGLAVYRVQTMDDAVAASTSRERFSMLLQIVFAAVALVLAVVGLYGVVSYTVARRTREIGIRMALGADRGRVLKLVVGQGMALVVVAVGVGLLVALAAGRVMASLLYGVSANDPLTYGGVAGVLLLVALVAVWIPARRASGIPPRSSLSAE